MRTAKTLLTAAVLLASSLVWTPTGAAQDLSPDLSVSDVECTGQLPCGEMAPGDKAQFEATFTNNGADPDQSNNQFRVWFNVTEEGETDPTYSKSFLVDHLAGGESREVRTSGNVSAWTVKAGQFELTAEFGNAGEGIDADQSESDNSDSLEFSAGPNLVLGEIKLDPAEPVENDEVTFRANVSNEGPIDVTNDFDVDFEIDGEVFSGEITKTLSEGESATALAQSTWTALEGDQEVNVSVDPNKDVAESNETDRENTDNNGSKTFTVAPAEPDLVVMKVRPAQETFSPQTSIKLEAVVKNVGTGPVENTFDVRFELNGDRFGDDPEASFGSELAPGENTTVTTDASWTSQQGEHEIRAKADHGGGGQGDIVESDEGNNARTDTLRVGRDLVVDEVTTDPSEPHEGEKVTVIANVTNQGRTGTSKPITIHIEAGDDFDRNVTVDGLNALSTRSIKVSTWTPQSTGDTTIAAEADTDGNVTEIEEGNNTLQRTIRVQNPLADLIVTEVNFPNDVSSGEDSTVEAKIKNNGSTPIEDTDVVNALYIGDQKEDEQTETTPTDVTDSNPWEGGQTRTVSFTWSSATRDNHTVRVATDIDDNVNELSEKNNNRSVTKLVGPDAAIEDIKLDPASPDTGDSVTFTAVVANEGNEVLDEADVNVTLDGTLLGQGTVKTIDPGENDTIQVTWEATSGGHEIRAEADPFGNVTEAREENNERTEEFSTSSVVDLVVTSIRFGGSPTEGDSVKFSVTVENRGDANVGVDFDLDFKIDGDRLSTSTIDGLEAGQSATVTSKSWKAEEGEHTVTAEADPADVVAEDDENNNKRFRTFDVSSSREQQTNTGPPNLVVTSISPPDKATVGDKVRFLATVENVGGEPASGSTLAFRINGEQLSQASVGKLDPGQSASLTSSSWRAVEGENKIVGIADVNHAVEEQNEDDNKRSVTLTVGDRDQQTEDQPDLSVSELGFPEGPPGDGETGNLSVTVENNGAASVGIARIQFTVDGEIVGETDVTDLASGSSTTVQVPWDANEGEHTFAAEADPANEVSESNENNNRIETSIEIEGQGGIPAPGPIGLALVLASAAALVRRRS